MLGAIVVESHSRAMRHLFFAASIALLAGCGGASSTPSTTSTTEPSTSVCDEIGRACHDVDPGDGLAHDCHVNAHTMWSEDECSARRHECMSACGAPGHESHDAPATETIGAEHGHDHADGEEHDAH